MRRATAPSAIGQSPDLDENEKITTLADKTKRKLREIEQLFVENQEALSKINTKLHDQLEKLEKNFLLIWIADFLVFSIKNQR